MSVSSSLAAASSSPSVGPIHAPDGGSISSSTSGECYLVEFELGNPAVERISGRITITHKPPTIQTEEDEDEDEDASTFARATPITDPDTVTEDTDDEDEDDSSLVYIFDIPAHLTLNELYNFLLDAHDLFHLQLCRIPSRCYDGVSNYAVFLRFQTSHAAKQFVKDFDGQPYNSLEPEACVAGRIREVLFEEEEKARTMPISSEYRGPMWQADDTHSAAAAAADPNEHATPTMAQLTLGKAHSRESQSPLLLGSCLPSSAAAAAAACVSASASHTPALAPTTEPCNTIPTCPVCLEQIMPSVASPMITILCNHVFHFDCLSKWLPSSSSSSCPVCRYMLQPNVDTQCSTCKTTDKLWLCMLCGHVGCSRYALGHAHQHFEETAHNYAIEVLTQRVWDYTADCYVHRLVRNKADGKLVEFSRVRTLDDDLALPSSSHATHSTPTKSLSGGDGTSMATSIAMMTPPGSTSSTILPQPNTTRTVIIQPSSYAYASVKLEEYILEYNYLLSSQLDQQRRIFQHSLHTCESGMRDRRTRLDRELTEARERRLELQAKIDKAHATFEESTTRLAQLEATHTALEATAAQLASLHARLLHDHSSVRASLETSSKLYQHQQESILSAQDATISGLEEQLHDLSFFLDTQKKIDRMDLDSKKAGKGGLKKKLQTGQAEIQLVEVAPTQEEENKARRKNVKRRG